MEHRNLSSSYSAVLPSIEVWISLIGGLVQSVDLAENCKMKERLRTLVAHGVITQETRRLAGWNRISYIPDYEECLEYVSMLNK
jgi:hypothetical protein